MKEPLSEYSRKRDFRKTPEPGARAPIGAMRARSKRPIFVVQEHHASHLHYDFRLEVDGVLRSWAVPKGPSMNPKEKRLAVEVEDHPLAYAKFVGKIPKGEYGGGEVFLWDQGHWHTEGDPAESIRKGKLDFELEGKKLKGKFLLLRTKKSGAKPQWLLIKRTDSHVATDTGTETIADPGKQPKREAAPKVKKKQDFLPLQLAYLVKEPPRGEEWVHERKFDGYRVQAVFSKGKVKLLTRTGLDWTDRYPTIAKALEGLRAKSAVIDGEVVWADEEGTGDFQKLQNSLSSGDLSSLHFYAFDLLKIDGKDVRALPLLERKARLLEILPKSKNSVVHFSQHDLGDPTRLLKEACDSKGEGIVSKLANAPYHSGRDESWVKSKCEQRQEFVIGGFTKGKREGFGALLLGLFSEGEFRYVGRVGTGFSRESIRELRNRLDPLRREESPFVNPPSARNVFWVEPELAAEISFANWTNDRRLRAPVFHGLREDKPATEIHEEKTLGEAGFKRRKKKSAKAPAAKSGLTLSNPDKIYFAEEGITKLDVAEFYAEVSPFLLPHLKNRPLSLRRCPDGTEESCFYHKHYSDGLPAAITPVTVEENKGPREHMKVADAEGLMALVQMGALEIHGWNSRAPDLTHPDQIVMDFDPGPGLKWKDVVKAAREFRNLAGEIGLECFVKVTGGKGLHVHIPIRPVYEWSQIKEFSRTLAREMASRDPHLYTTSMSKSERKGKIFLDYLRNERMATNVLPYSLRAREKSAVAMPLEWEELGRLSGSDAFRLEKALEKVSKRKRDPWEGYFLEQEIEILSGGAKAA